MEHQLQKATVTKAAHSPKPVKTETRYRYDAFGRRLEKKDAFGQTLFEWDGNRLLSEQRGSNHKLYLYEADSFAPLAQVQLNPTEESKPKQPLAQTEQAPAAIKLELPGDEGDDWHPRKTAAAFAQQMRDLQKQVQARARGVQQPAQEPPADFDDTLPPDFDDTLPPQEEHEEATSKVISLKDWRVRYYHNDHLGTPRELSDEDGSIVWQATYRAWGNTIRVEAAQPRALQKHELLAHGQQALQAQNDPNPQELPIEQNLRFQGQYYDQETGLHYNRFRYYDPDVGRFVSQDPIGLNGGDNLYFYAINSLTWIDPFGLSPRRRRNPHPTNAQHHNKKKLCRVGSSGKIISSADARKIDYLFDNKNDAMNAAARMLGPGATRTYNDKGQWNGWQSSRGSVYWNHGDWAQGQGSSNFPHLNYDISGKQGHLFMGDKIEAAGMTDVFDTYYEGRPTDGCR